MGLVSSVVPMNIQLSCKDAFYRVSICVQSILQVSSFQFTPDPIRSQKKVLLYIIYGYTPIYLCI